MIKKQQPASALENRKIKRMQGKAHHRTAGNDAGRIVFQALGTLLDKVAVKCPDADTIITRFVNGVAADSDDTLITGQVVFNCQSRLHCSGYIIDDYANSRGKGSLRDNAAGNGIDQMAFATLRIFFGTDNDADIRIVSSKLIKKLDSPWFIIFDGNDAFVG